MLILGLSAFYHDSAACIIKDGEILAAAQEERFSRIKHDQDFPVHAINYCLAEAGIAPNQIDYIVFYDKPFLKFDRLLETYLAFAPKGLNSFIKSLPVWLKDKLFQKSTLVKKMNGLWGSKIDWGKRLLFSEHHLSHAASAFFCSPFMESAVLTMDGVGEWVTTSIAIGKDNNLEIKKELYFPHSLGLLYSAITYFIGFKVNSGEYKVMGLAPYGKPIYTDLLRSHVINIKEDGSFHLDMSYFDFCTGDTMTSKKFNQLFGRPPRNPESDLTQFDMDLAASVQSITEDIVIKIAKEIAVTTGQKNLCLAGGVALNCVANGVLQRESIFENIWIQPAAGDAGGALGAALATYYLHTKQPRIIKEFDCMKGAYLGPQYSQNSIEEQLTNAGATYITVSDDEVINIAAKSLANGDVIGWHQGRMEFGPRSLGGRSILADPRSPTIQKRLNLKIKYRESFRPFAPSILSEEVQNWFQINCASPYMLMVAKVHPAISIPMTEAQETLFGIDKLNVPKSTIPAVTHIDYSARIQTVHKETNPRFHGLLEKFNAITKCPVLVNTSFNVRGEPIVESPLDAFRCFMGTDIELLIIGNCILRKIDQDPSLRQSYINKYKLD